MGWEATVRAVQAARRREQREAKKRQRELERLANEQAKLSALDQARLEVERYESRLEVLLSVHKEQGDVWDWLALAAALSPPRPERRSNHEQRAKQRLLVSSPQQRVSAESTLAEARAKDEQVFREAMNAYETEKTHWEKMRALARRILDGEHGAYKQVLVEFSPLSEISELGSCAHFTIHSKNVIEVKLKVNGTQAVPSEAKTLTASGRVSVKTMAKGRFHEIYQDYVCGCILRVAREVFALLPVETLLITACVEAVDSRTGEKVEQPVLSVVMPRAALSRLNFDRLDPSDSFENFLHRGDFKRPGDSGHLSLSPPYKAAGDR
jgi:hypothetical protein